MANFEMDKQAYLMGEFTHCAPFPIKDTDKFKIQIVNDDGMHRRTRWLDITPDQFKAIETLLLEVNHD